MVTGTNGYHSNGHDNGVASSTDTWTAKAGLAQMLKGGVIMDVANAEQARIGHFVEAQVLEAVGADHIDESEVLTPADEQYHIEKHAFTVPFVCGAARGRR